MFIHYRNIRAVAAFLVASAFFAFLCNTSSGQTIHENAISGSLNTGSSYSLHSKEIEFIENKGQLADQYGKPMPDVLYSSDAKGMKCYLTAKGMHFVFGRMNPSVGRTSDLLTGIAERRFRPISREDILTLQRLDMEFTGANPYPRIEAKDVSEGYFNYYLAHCKLSNVHAYHKVIYHDLYPHIDFVIYSSPSRYC